MNHYAVKMRASAEGKHISGAEKIVPSAFVAETAARLAERALNHPKGAPDFINLKIEAPDEILRLKSLKVTTYETSSEAEGRAKATELLRGAGLARIDEIMTRFAETSTLRGAMLLDVDTLERLEPDTSRGIRATYMDDADSLLKGTASGKNHYAEAIVLATKVAHAPGIVGEICVSDDPDYVTGYVATRDLGYCRITTIKTKGSPVGGRIFLYRGSRERVAETIRFLEHQAVIVEDVPILRNNDESRRDSLEHELEKIRAAGCYRTIPPPPPSCARPLLSLASNDYLGLANDPRVKQAAADAALIYGAGSTGSRLVTGTQRPHLELERHLAAFKGAEAARVWATGYMANVGVISALVKKGDVILSDALNHASIIDGCRLSGAEIKVYRHLDMDDLGGKLADCRAYRRRLVVSDAVFSMDGDILNLPRFLELCREFDAFSMIDEAHATGVLGATGRGLAEHFNCQHADITIGTLSKALGSSGGYVVGSQTLIDYLTNTSRSFIFSTALGAANLAAANAALTILETETERVERLRHNVELFITELRACGINAATESAIVPIIVGDEHRALEIADKLKRNGFMISAIRYPTVAKGAARLRVALSSELRRETLRAAAQAIGEALRADA